MTNNYKSIRLARRTTPEQEDDLKRYVGCKVKLWRERDTVVTGPLQAITVDYVNIGGLVISLERNDCLWWDQNGPKPQTVYTSEEQEFAKVLYDARQVLEGGISWSQLSAPVKDVWCGMAREGLKWVDGEPGCRGEGRV